MQREEIPAQFILRRGGIGATFERAEEREGAGLLGLLAYVRGGARGKKVFTQDRIFFLLFHCDEKSHKAGTGTIFL